jgi:hypothetical protein
MRKYIIFLLVFVLLAQPKLAQVERAEMMKNRVMITGHVPCQSVVWAVPKTKAHVTRINVYYKKSSRDLRGCTFSGQKYMLLVAAMNGNTIYVNGIRITRE